MSNDNRTTTAAAVAVYLRSLEIGPLRSHGALAVAPLFECRGGTATLDYLTFEPATAAGFVVVDETSPSGTVPLLRVSVRGAVPVLLVEGEVLSGGKQTRILNTSVLARANARTEIPVSCVERGRWHGRSTGFGSSPSFGSSSLRGRKSASVTSSLASSAERPSFESDQGAVWSEVDRELRSARARSGTSSFEAVRNERAAWLAAATEALLPAFESAEQAPTVGCVALVSGQPVALDVFDRPATFAGLACRLLEGYALDAADRAPPALDGWALETLARAFVERAASSAARSFPSPGLGTDHRLEGQGVRGFALEHEGTVLHVACFAA